MKYQGSNLKLNSGKRHGPLQVIDTSPRFLAVDLEKQLLPGSFEYAVHHLLEREFDLSIFDTRYRNDRSGATAYPPGMLLKVILCAYAQGVVSSRGIERLCREHVTFIALSGDCAPHFTTLAAFVSSLDEEVAKLFAQVLYLCDRQGLIGREMFAIDGVKLPSNASKAKSGTRADFAHQADKLEAAAQKMLERHRQNDTLPVEPDLAEKQRQKAERLQQEAAELRDWLTANPQDRKGSKGTIRKSNRTDPDSAKMATGKGVIQGYTGVAAADAKHQIIIEAQAHGTGSEQELLLQVVRATRPHATPETLYTADAGYHSETNLQALAEEHIPALIADNGMRQRDERFKDQGKHKAKPDPLYDKAHPKKSAQRYRPQDFSLDPETGICTCPAGKPLYRNGSNCIHNGYVSTKYTGAQRDCLPCERRAKCLRTPEKTKVRQRRIRIQTVGAREFHLDHFQAVGSALLRRKRLVIRYHARGTDEVTEREVSPQRLNHYRDNWYLDAWCHLRDGLRAFAVDAIKHAEILDTKAKDVSDKRLDEALGSGYGVFSGDQVAWAMLRFTPERARWVASERWHRNQEGKFLEDGSYELRVPYADDRELIMDIMKYGSDCEVIEPEALKARVAAEFESGLARYRQ